MNYVLDGLRTEFPSLFGAFTRVRLPLIRRELPVWAFLSALGASLIVGGILHVALLAAPRSVTDLAIRWPFGATLASMVTFASSAVAGNVLVRVGGSRAVLIYVAYALLEVLASLPNYLLFCDRTGGDGACNAPLIYIAAFRAPEWLGVSVGILAAIKLSRAERDGPNRMLRGAGAFGLTLFALMVPLSYAMRGIDAQQLHTAVFLIAYALAGVVAGVVLRTARFAAALLVAVVVVAPTLGLSLPLLHNGPSNEPIEFTFTRYANLFAPAISGACVIAAWLLARRRLRSSTPSSHRVGAH